MNATSSSIIDSILARKSNKANREPPSGESGNGTIESPYDQGNAPEQDSLVSAKSGTEPPSGKQGQGTVDSPYDQGNAPEQAAGPGIEPPSGQQGKGTINSPYDQGNQPGKHQLRRPSIRKQSYLADKNHAENTAATSESSKSPLTPALPPPSDPLASPSTTHQGSGNPTSEPTPEQEKVISEQRGRDEKAQHTTSTAEAAATKSTGTAAAGGHFGAEQRFERSISPGQLADGTHVQCSGDKGQSYDPGASTMNKIKDKFHFGKH